MFSSYLYAIELLYTTFQVEMVGEECVSAMTEVTEPRRIHTPKSMFLVPSLDTAEQRQEIVTEIQEFLVSGVYFILFSYLVQNIIPILMTL